MDPLGPQPSATTEVGITAIDVIGLRVAAEVEAQDPILADTIAALQLIDELLTVRGPLPISPSEVARVLSTNRAGPEAEIARATQILDRLVDDGVVERIEGNDPKATSYKPLDTYLQAS